MHGCARWSNHRKPHGHSSRHSFQGLKIGTHADAHKCEFWGLGHSVKWVLGRRTEVLYFPDQYSRWANSLYQYRSFECLYRHLETVAKYLSLREPDKVLTPELWRACVWRGCNECGRSALVILSYERGTERGANVQGLRLYPRNIELLLFIAVLSEASAANGCTLTTTHSHTYHQQIIQN